MKAIKIISWILAILLIGYFASSWYLKENLDRIVKETIEETGSKQLSTGITLDAVKVSIPTGRASLTGLSVANPPGYSANPVFTLGSIDVDIDLSTLTDDVLVIEEITISDPLVSFELNEEDVSNLDVLEKKIAAAAGSSGGGNPKRFIIDRLDFKGGTITATTARTPDQQLVFDFPVVFMTDLGSPNGAPAEQIANEVAAVLLERSMDAAKRAGVQKLMDTQKERLEEKAKEKLGEKLKDIFKRD